MKLLFLLSLVCCYSIGNAETQKSLSYWNFNVLDYGARANGITDDSKAFMAAWKAACAAVGVVKLHIPAGTYLIGPTKFAGPCKNVHSLTVNMKGYLKATTDLSQYVTGDDWVEFAWVDMLILTGGGTFDGQGAVSWPYNKCPTNKHCKVLPTSVKFVATSNTLVQNIKSLNSKFFHIALVGCKNFWGKNIQITAPSNSPNTDGIHIERSTGVTIYNSVIGTGDDCISIGHSNSEVLLSGISCGPGHGISIGSLGRYHNEGDVRGLVIKDSTLAGTSNGVRIKTWENSPGTSKAVNMTFENIVMNSVANPIIIDQMYCPYSSCASDAPSGVILSDIFFRNIRGTSTTPVAVTLRCSRGVPCKNVNLQDVNLKYVGQLPATASCMNVKASYSGTQIPPPCR
ncbi:exopolygalacturonase-like isoform X1 [Elaeis guineensis]|uniref:exopolygalacturonase-like isoform X1 n=1 Tax=Elaeis guineensis var. tenera TaxID=51953 RepID=UPI003C6D0289